MLVAIATAQAEYPSNIDQYMAIIDQCNQKIGQPCKNGTDDENEACKNTVGQIWVCAQKCNEDNNDNANKTEECYKNQCNSDNIEANNYFENLYKCIKSPAQVETPSENIDNDQKMAKIEKCTQQIGYPCKNGSDDENSACTYAVEQMWDCVFKCNDNNKGNSKKTEECYKNQCKTDNNEAYIFFENLYKCMNSGINILDFTSIASALALLL
ncbi:hypothetical protein ABPG72_020557 [Tetrahymena utriculariae]